MRVSIPNSAAAFDAVAFDAAIRAGHGPAILRELNRTLGLTFDSRLGDIRFIAQDAQPELVTQSNAGIPAFLSNYLDPKLIEVLVSPMKAAQILGETKKGDWTTTVATFPVVESTGEVSSYGDYNANGSVDVNLNFPQRQAYQYQTFTQWGERELDMAALAKVDWASRVNIASVLLLNKFQNTSYFFGIAGLQNYGLLNDPSLYAPIAPTAAWNLSSTTAEEIYEDIRRMFVQLQNQADGVVDQEMPMVLAMSPVTSVALNKTNSFNVNVMDQLKKNFPKLRVETAVEYNTTSGQLVQMIVENIEGQETATCAFTEKLRAHAIVVDSSSWKQKKSQGTFGTVIYRPFAISQMIGV
jgi:hypothetical protein